jgi:hypothetical protein
MATRSVTVGKLEDAHRVIDSLERLDISLRDATTTLPGDGVAIFCSAFERLLVSVRDKAGAIDQQAVAQRPGGTNDQVGAHRRVQ